MVRLEEAAVLSRSRNQDLGSVRKLNLWGSELEDISIVRKMPNLEVVSLSVNNITTLADFKECLNLQELYVRNNDIEDLNEVWYLTQLPKLKILWLSENPCAQGSKYRLTVIRSLPALTMLDNVPVTAEERSAALEEGAELLRPSIPPTVPPQPAPLRPDASGPAQPPAEGRQALKGSSDQSISPSVFPKKLSQAVVYRFSVRKPRPTGSDVGNKTHRKPMETDVCIQLKAPKLGEPAAAASHITPVPAAASRYPRSANILHAVLCLLKELDEDDLARVYEEVQTALQSVR